MTSTNQYQHLDDAIVRAVRSGINKFASLQADYEVSAEVDRIVAWHGGEAFRYVDRRLQALRRVGRIAYSKKAGWVEAGHAGEAG